MSESRIAKFQGVLIEDDRVPAIIERVATLETASGDAAEQLATIPTVPVEPGTYIVTVDAEFAATFTPFLLPALPTSAGDYKLVVTVSGEPAVTSYAWAAIV